MSFNALAGTSISDTALAPGVQRRIIGHYGPFSWSFDSVGVIYDRHEVVLLGEFIERRTSNPAINVNGYYFLGGYHLQRLTPYAMYSVGETVGGAERTIPFAAMHVISGGVRFDAFKNVDLKA